GRGRLHRRLRGEVSYLRSDGADDFLLPRFLHASLRLAARAAGARHGAGRQDGTLPVALIHTLWIRMAGAADGHSFDSAIGRIHRVSDSHRTETKRRAVALG